MNILRLYCHDRPGIVAAVASTLRDNNCNIEESAQFNDHLSGQFYMRVVFSVLREGCLESFVKNFDKTARDFSMHWEIFDGNEKVKTLVMVSQHDHCLNDLLYRWRTSHLPFDIVGIVSNHEISRQLVESHKLPFHYLPLTAKTKQQQEQAVQDIIKKTGAELVVLARYMQILSENFCNNHKGHIINIHHSFLPGFKGAKPYHQAYERGVKIIGATAHFVTTDLDEGPIIAQNVVPVDHNYTPKKMQALGQDIEAGVLAQAIRLYAERRVFLHGRRTIIL